MMNNGYILCRVSDEKSFQYAKRMFSPFRAIVKFCSTNRLFTLFNVGEVNNSYNKYLKLKN